jgi:hypothetical protein
MANVVISSVAGLLVRLSARLLVSCFSFQPPAIDCIHPWNMETTDVDGLQPKIHLMTSDVIKSSILC